MAEKSLRVLVALGEVSELLLVRRLLRDTPYLVDVARAAPAARRGLRERGYHAVVTDDERLPGATGAEILAEARQRQPKALCVLLARPERMSKLAKQARGGGFRLLARPFFAPQLRGILLDHAAHVLERELPSRSKLETAEIPVEAETVPVDVTAGGGRRLLLTMVELVEARCGSAPGHALRVHALSVALGREAGLKGPAIAALEEAALLHDVGELAVPEALLREPRRLTPAEHRRIRIHVEAGAQVVRRAGLARPVETAILHHHERWDGKGHPSGLRGQAIPMLARIIAVADTFDALAVPRPFREAMPPEECVRTLRLLGGAQLDRELVELFLRRDLHRQVDWTAARTAVDLFSHLEATG